MLQNCCKNIHTNDSTNDVDRGRFKEGLHSRNTQTGRQTSDDFACNLMQQSKTSKEDLIVFSIQYTN